MLGWRGEGAASLGGWERGEFSGEEKVLPYVDLRRMRAAEDGSKDRMEYDQIAHVGNKSRPVVINDI